MLTEQRLDQVFKMIDIDQSGEINRSEIKEFFSMSGNDEEFLSDMIREVDNNDDGCISFEEFKSMMTKFKNNI